MVEHNIPNSERDAVAPDFPTEIRDPWLWWELELRKMHGVGAELDEQLRPGNSSNPQQQFTISAGTAPTVPGRS
jgi:hypothetical protein